MSLPRILPILFAAFLAFLPALAFAQETPPAVPAADHPVTEAVTKAVDDAGKSLAAALADEIHAAEATLAGIASEAVLYLAIALAVGLAVGMVLGSLLSSLVLRGTIRRALAAGR